ncbi:peptide chain release factor N(5)-glutamine methyltransferase, partial [Aestuariivirga sp.]|uniref:peptide chain release factor N(5)-glutamine methyltransferase n=1 Tax=Aestuariivirga sp. TaxID=2650926 RepID=UPI00391B9D51
ILDPGSRLAQEDVQRFRGYVERRAGREPVSRILGEREFYGRPFRVTPDVLDPRPDTETLVDGALRLVPANARLLDLGTGSGAIIVTLLAERPDASGVATDISPAALAVARENAERNGVLPRLDFAQGSWFGPVSGRFDLILSNPPYIPAAEIPRLSPDVRNFDPVLALVGGNDGLTPYRELAAGASAHLVENGRVLVEIGAGQADQVEAIFVAAGLRPAGRYQDLGGHVRCLGFRR